MPLPGAPNKRVKQPNRFHCYDIDRPLRRPQDWGLASSAVEWDLGCPSVARQEDISLLASNAERHTLQVRIRWRPHLLLGQQLVTVATSLTIELGDGRRLEHQQAITYAPSISTHGDQPRVLQYGAGDSALRLTIGAPYRCLRLTFCGYMRDAWRPDAGSVFVRLAMVAVPTGSLFDFTRELNEKLLAKQMRNNNNVKPADFKSLLLALDRHEQPIQLKGELFVDSSTANKAAPGPESQQTGPQRTNLYLWGFHSRHFVGEPDNRLRTTSVYGHFINGRLFHLVLARPSGEASCGQHVEFGYCGFESRTQTAPFTDTSGLDWAQLTAASPTKPPVLKGRLSGQNRSFDFEASPEPQSLGERQQSRFLVAKLGSHTGWALVCSEADPELELMSQLSTESRLAYEEAFTNYRLARRFLSMLPADGSSSSQPLVLALSQQASIQAELTGAKAASLALMYQGLHCYEADQGLSRLSFDLAPGLVVTRHGHDLVFACNPELDKLVVKLEKFLGASNRPDPAKLGLELDQLRSAIEAASFPAELSAELRAKLDSMEPAVGETHHEDAFAVRSSSWGEDEEDMSSAGQLTTLLGVRGFQAIQRAVLACIASKFTPANVEYKRQRGLSPALPVAVVVQRMVRCRSAGVAFGCNPTSGDTRQILITANYGIGESVVNGSVEPDTVLLRVEGPLDEQLTIESRHIGSKEAIVDLPVDGDLIETSATEAGLDRGRLCLEDADLLRVAAITRQLSRFFEAPRDIEWAITAQGVISVLQSRPVTGLRPMSDFEVMHENDQPSRAQSDIVTRANLCEVMPYATSPLSQRCTFGSWDIFAFKVERRIRKNVKFTPECPFHSYWNSWHMFMRVRGHGMLNNRLPSGEKTNLVRAVEASFFGRELESRPDLLEACQDNRQPLPGPFVMQIFKFLTLDLRFRGSKTILKERSKHEQSRAKFAKLVQTLSQPTVDPRERLLALYAHFNQLLNTGNTSCRNHGMNFLISSEYQADIADFIEINARPKIERDRIQPMVARLISMDKSGALSAQIPHRIGQMADAVGGLEAQQNFANMPKSEALDYINSGSNQQLTEEFNKFIKKFGHRCYNEFDASERSWAYNQLEVVKMVQLACLGSIGNKQTQNSNNKAAATNKSSMLSDKSDQLLDQTLNQLGIGLSEVQRFKLKHWYLKRCTTMVSLRELGKDVLIYYCDLLRESSRELAAELRRQLRIPDEDLLYFFTYGELDRLIMSNRPQPVLVSHANRRRQVHSRMFKNTWAYDDLITDYKCIPMHLQDKPEERPNGNSSGDDIVLRGIPACPGKVEGRVCIVSGYHQLDLVQSGDILVAHSIDIAFASVFPVLSGLITETGGLISHGVVVAREYGIPCILAAVGASRVLHNGSLVSLDADVGVVRQLADPLPKVSAQDH